MSKPILFPVITPDVCRTYVREYGKRQGKSALVRQVAEKLAAQGERVLIVVVPKK